MENPTLSRRTLLTAGSATLAGLALLNVRFAQAAPLQAGEEVIPWLDQPPESPVPPEVLTSQLVWEQVDSWITPNDKFFSIAHYNRPEIDAKQWQLEITGLVKKPLTLTLDQIRARKKQEVTRLLQQINKRIRENREKQAILSGTQELAFGKEQPNDTTGRTT